MNMVWQEIEDRYGDDQPFKKYDGFDDAIVAITEGVNECRVAYDIEKLIEILNVNLLKQEYNFKSYMESQVR